MARSKDIMQVLYDFGQNTSILGISNAAKAKSRTRSTIWLIIFTAFACATIYGITTSVLEYFTYPVVTTTEITYKSEIDFPGVTVCNLNRVNCHNAFIAMYNLKLQLNDASLTSEERTNIEESFQTTKILLEEDASNCMIPVCSNIKESIGNIIIPMKNSTILNLFMMLENGCVEEPQTPPESEDPLNEFQKYCQFLTIIQENSTENFTRDKASTLFQSLNCNVTRVCEFCIQPGGGGGGGQGGPPGGGDGGGQQKCINEIPQICTDLGLNPNEGGSQNPRPGQRRKRSPDAGGPESPAAMSISQLNKETNANFVKNLLSLPESIKRGIGHNLKKTWSIIEMQDRLGFIVNCDYKGINCSDESFWDQFTHPKYGNCFIFNSGLHGREVRQVTVTGSDNGLVLELFLDQTNYMYNKLSKAAGARINIHDPYSIPRPDEFGLNVSPNTATSLSIQVNEMTRMPAPYKSNCTASWAPTGYNVSTNYSLSLCNNLCHTDAIIANCSCFWPELSLPDIEGVPSPINHHTPCNIMEDVSNQDWVCYTETMKQFDRRERICPCEVACQERDFQATVSSSTWPSNQYWKYFALEVGTYDPVEINAGGKRGEEIKAEIQQDYAKINIYYQTLNVQSISQSESMTFFGLMTNLGGGLSLYLGIAIAMLFELVEFIFDVIEAVFDSRKKR